MKLFALAATLVLGGASCSSPSLPSFLGMEASTPHGANKKADLPSLLKELMSTNPRKEASVKCDKKPCVPKYRFKGDVDEDSVGEAIDWLEAAKKAGATSIVFEINSKGGSVDDGFDLIKAMEDLELPIECVVDGEGYSMGFGILQGKGCSTRVMTKRSTLMIHGVSVRGLMSGNERDFQNITDHLRVVSRAFMEICGGRLKISVDELRERVKAEGEIWLDHESALSLGAVDLVR